MKEIEEHNAKLPEGNTEKEIRKDALYLLGVDNMSTDEIFAFFGNMDPTHIEWINDESCNVIWTEEKQASISYLRIAKPPTAKTPIIAKKDSVSDADADAFDELDLEMNMDVEEEDQKEVENKEEVTALSLFSPQESSNPLRQCKEPFVKNGKEHILQVRFSCVCDQKRLGAAKKSSYYVKYGNPHYGGKQGLLSGSYRKRYQMKKAMNELKEMNVGSWVKANHGSEDNHANKTKRSESEKEDESLMKSSAKDLDGAIPVDFSSSEDEELGSMVADRVAKERKSVRPLVRKTHGDITVTKVVGGVRSRLGRSRHDREWNNDRYEQRNVLDKLPNDLRNRLGRKRDDKSSMSRSRRERSRSPLSRKMRSYSPPPWED